MNKIHIKKSWLSLSVENLELTRKEIVADKIIKGLQVALYEAGDRFYKGFISSNPVFILTCSSNWIKVKGVILKKEIWIKLVIMHFT